jgi:hypothetical protein
LNDWLGSQPQLGLVVTFGSMAELTIQITKRADGRSVLRCIRADGSATWQTRDGRSASFFPLHDLTHYVVEQELGFGRGFYGLIAEGWEIQDTEGKGVRGPLPDEAHEVEHLVGALDLERAGAVSWTAAELTAETTRQARAGGRAAPRTLSDEEIVRIRGRLRECYARWAALLPDATLELTFERGRST